VPPFGSQFIIEVHKKKKDSNKLKNYYVKFLYNKKEVHVKACAKKKKRCPLKWLLNTFKDSAIEGLEDVCRTDVHGGKWH
jgi:hypothetical protein